LLERVLLRRRRDGNIRQDVSAIDIVITGAMLAQPLPHAADWNRLARRQASIYVAGLATTTDPLLPGPTPTRPQLEAGFCANQSASRPSRLAARITSAAVTQ